MRDPVWRTINVVNIERLTTSTEATSTELHSVSCQSGKTVPTKLDYSAYRGGHN